jgi:glycosyltransferase involved in cell wall biosynthesis
MFEGIMTAKISVAMATYNGERFIREQLDSLAAQTLPPCELVVTDDGSTDATLAIIEEFCQTAPFPVHVHRNESRLGYADNFLKAASLCEGEFVAFCDQDDVWSKEKIAICTAHLKATDAHLCIHSINLIDKFGKPIPFLFPDFLENRNPERFSFDPLKIYPGFTFIFRKSLLDIIDSASRPFDSRFSTPIKLSHDQWVIFLASVFGHIVIV